MGTPAGEGGGGKDKNKGSSLTKLDYHTVPFPSLSTSAILDARAIWWRQKAQGHRLPAELGVILIDGGANMGATATEPPPVPGTGLWRIGPIITGIVRDLELQRIATAARYSRLNPEIVRAFRGERFPPLPIHEMWR